jgi:hypothetical protein
LADDKFIALLTSIDARCAALNTPAMTPFQRVRRQLAARDGLLFLYLRESFQRGGEGAAVRLVDITIPGDPRALIPADPRLLEARVVRVTPPRLKGHHGPPGLGIDIVRGPTPATCLLRRLHAFAVTSAELGLPLAPPYFHLFRPMDSRRRTTLQDVSLTTAALQSRLRDALERLGLYEGETTHSFRRAAFQTARARGELQAVTMEKALITTNAVYNLYCNTGRPTRYRPAAEAGLASQPPAPVESPGRVLSRQLCQWMTGRVKVAEPTTDEAPSAEHDAEAAVIDGDAGTRSPSPARGRDASPDADAGAAAGYTSPYERSMAQLRARKRQRVADPPGAAIPVAALRVPTPAPATCVVQ